MPVVIPAIAAAIVTAIGATGVAATVATLAIETALSIGLSLGLSALSQIIAGDNRPKPPHAQRENIRNPLAPRLRFYGRVRVGGTYAFLKVGAIADSEFDSPQALYQVIILGSGEWDFIEEHWLADGKVLLSGNVVIKPRNFHWNGHSYVRIQGHTGTLTQAADSLMTANWPGQWTSAFQGKEVPYAVIASISPDPINFTKVFPAGLPQYSAVGRGCKVWDPRKNPSSPTTKNWDDNLALVILDALTNPDGVGVPLEMIQAAQDVWSAEADYCDTIRETKDGGSERHLRLAGGYQLTDPPKNYLQKMLVPGDARLGLRGDGAVVLDVGRWREPEVTFTDSEVYSYSNLSRGKQKADIRNQINATFVAEAYGYTQQQADPILNESSIDIDGLQPATLDLDFAPSHPQAKVRMKIESVRQDPTGWSGTIVTNAYGLKFLNANVDGSRRRIMRLQLSDFAIDSTFEVQKFSFDHKTGRCTFTIQEMGPDAWNFDPATDEGTAPAFPRDTAGNGVEDPFNLQVSVSGRTIHASIDAPINSALQPILDYRRTDDAKGDDWVAYTLIANAISGTTGTLANGRYDVRACLKNLKTLDRSDPRIIRGIIIGGFFAGQSADDVDTTGVPGHVTTPAFVQPPQSFWDDPNIPEVWIAAGSINTNWQLAFANMSTDGGATYNPVGFVPRQASYGTITAPLASHADPDSADTLSVDVSASGGPDIESVTQSETDAKVSLCAVDSEFIAYRDSTKTSVGHFDLGGYLRRGLEGTPIASHLAGASFVLLDDAILRVPYDRSLIGSAVKFKFQSDNPFGTQLEALGSVTAYDVTLQPPVQGDIFAPTTEPPSPSSGWTVWADVDGKLKAKNSSGTIEEVATP